MQISELQAQIERTYGERDRARGKFGTFLWLSEEFGELAEAIRKGEKAEIELEFADCLAWLVSMANLEDVDLEKALQTKYKGGCSRCDSIPCDCKDTSAVKSTSDNA